MGVPAVQKAKDFIIDKLKNQTWREGDRLPSIAALSGMAGVSLVTMWKAVGMLKRQGSINTRRGSRIYAGAGRSTIPPVSTRRSGSLEAKRILVEQDLLKGYFAPGKHLPTISELQARYGVCYGSMRKVLDALALDRVIIPDKKGFLFPILGKKTNPRLCA